MADQLITPVDVEQAIIDELSSLYEIGTKIPDPKPPVFLRVIRIGGTQVNLVVDRPTVVLEAFGLKESDASAAIADALARIELAIRKGGLGDEVAYDLEVFGLPQNYPLPSVPTHARYIITIAPALRRRVTTL